MKKWKNHQSQFNKLIHQRRVKVNQSQLCQRLDRRESEDHQLRRRKLIRVHNQKRTIKSLTMKIVKFKRDPRKESWLMGLLKKLRNNQNNQRNQLSLRRVNGTQTFKQLLKISIRRIIKLNHFWIVVLDVVIKICLEQPMLIEEMNNYLKNVCIIQRKYQCLILIGVLNLNSLLLIYLHSIINMKFLKYCFILKSIFPNLAIMKLKEMLIIKIEFVISSTYLTLLIQVWSVIWRMELE